MFALSFAAPRAFSAESSKIPAKAFEAMSFFVGDWEAEAFENGEKIGNVDRRRWAPGKHCLIVETSGGEEGAEYRDAAICGWDAEANALIEHWHGSLGSSATISYPLKAMSKDVWEGVFSYITGDGKSSEGKCQLAKTRDGFVWTGRWMQDGKEAELKSVARKVTGMPAAKDTPQAGVGPPKVPAKAIKAMGYFVGSWEGEDITDGRKLGDNHDQRRWMPGKHCLWINWSGTHDGVASQFSGICGWDPKAKAIVDHWYGSQGDLVMVSYPLDKMKENVWEGTFKYVTGDGKSNEGTCQFTTTPERGVWIARSTQDGKGLVFESIAHRVKPKKTSGDSPKKQSRE